MKELHEMTVEEQVDWLIANGESASSLNTEKVGVDDCWQITPSVVVINGSLSLKVVCKIDEQDLDNPRDEISVVTQLAPWSEHSYLTPLLTCIKMAFSLHTKNLRYNHLWKILMQQDGYVTVGVDLQSSHPDIRLELDTNYVNGCDLGKLNELLLKIGQTKIQTFWFEYNGSEWSLAPGDELSASYLGGGSLSVTTHLSGSRLSKLQSASGLSFVPLKEHSYIVSSLLDLEYGDLHTLGVLDCKTTVQFLRKLASEFNTLYLFFNTCADLLDYGSYCYEFKRKVDASSLRVVMDTDDEEHTFILQWSTGSYHTVEIEGVNEEFRVKIGVDRSTEFYSSIISIFDSLNSKVRTEELEEFYAYLQDAGVETEADFASAALHIIEGTQYARTSRSFLEAASIVWKTTDPDELDVLEGWHPSKARPRDLSKLNPAERQLRTYLISKIFETHEGPINFESSSNNQAKPQNSSIFDTKEKVNPKAEKE